MQSGSFIFIKDAFELMFVYALTYGMRNVRIDVVDILEG